MEIPATRRGIRPPGRNTAEQKVTIYVTKRNNAARYVVKATETNGL